MTPFPGSNALAKLGLERHKGEGAGSFAQRIAASQPGLADSAARIAHLYSSIRYNTYAGSGDVAADDKEALRKLRAEVSHFLREVSTMQRTSPDA